MVSIVLFSHGSLLCGAGQALDEHARRLQEAGLAERVVAGYLNYSEPRFAQTVAELTEDGATHILVAPYFLVPGYFVQVALPKVVAAAEVAHPGVRFQIAEPIGFDPQLADALRESARAALPAHYWREDLRLAGRFCRRDPECPLYGKPGCPAIPSQTPCSHPASEAPAARSGTIAPKGPQREALLVMVHGSPQPTANDEMLRVVALLRQVRAFPIVEPGYMECNQPDIPTAIDTCVTAGASRVLAVPYFLHTGTHVADDLPSLLEEGARRHPAVEFRMGEFLGRSERLTSILADRIRTVLHAGTQDAGQSDRPPD